MVNYALIGCGKIAKRHSRILGNNLVKGAKLVAVCDTDTEKATSIADELKVNAYSDLESMMQNEPVDVAVILTGSGSHAELALKLAHYKKDIIIEKPIALTLEDSQEIINACDKEGVRLFVVKQNRFNVPVMALKEAIRNGRVGKLSMGTIRMRWSRSQEYYDQEDWRGTWLMDGGVLANQAIHLIDLLQWMMGDVESVFAYSTNAIIKMEAEDTAVIVIRFKNGALGLVEATTATRPKDLEGSLSILGEKGTVEIGGYFANELKIWDFIDEEEGEGIDHFSENPYSEFGYGHQAFYDSVTSCIINNQDSFLDGYEAMKSLRIIHAAYESIETGKEVSINDQFNHSKLGK